MIEWWNDPDVCKVASTVAARFRGYTDVEDIKSELVVWCLENTSTANLVWAGPWWFKQRRLWTIAQRYARREKATAVGHEIEDEFFYSPFLVRHMLADAFDADATPPTKGIVEVKPRGGNSVGAEWETMIADLQRALQLLPAADFDLLWTLYSGQGCTLTAYCAVKKWDYRKGVKAERAAVRKLVDLLGGTTPWQEDISTSPPDPQETAPEPRTGTKTVGATHG